MTGGTPRRPNAEPITAGVAQRVRHHRKRLGWSQDDMLDALAKVGVHWTRTTLLNLETRAPSSKGQGLGRDALTLQEFLGLALALGVPPVALLFDVSHSESTQITTEVSGTPLDAALWAIGRQPLEGSRATVEAWRETQEPLVNAWYAVDAINSLRTSMALPGDGGEDAARMDRQLLARLVKALRQLRAIAHPAPKVPEFVVRRANELDVDLFGGG
jgi:transcriptional regulator with XRE-family HTH domain